MYLCFRSWEIFGGAYGVLIIILVVMILLQNYVSEMMNDPRRIGGIAETTISEQAGTVISVYQTHLKIEETQEVVTLEELRSDDNEFYRYARTWFTGGADAEKVALFFVYPNCNNVFLEAERTLASLDIRSFNQLIINREMVDRLKELNKRPDSER